MGADAFDTPSQDNLPSVVGIRRPHTDDTGYSSAVMDILTTILNPGVLFFILGFLAILAAIVLSTSGLLILSQRVIRRASAGRAA